MALSTKTIGLEFPVGGVAKRYAYQHQGPYTTVSAVNVRPDDTILGRERGGSRPGLRKMFSQQLGAAGNRNIMMAADVTYITSNTIKTRCVFAANGTLYQEEPAGTLASVASGVSLSLTQRIMAVDRLQKLFIADWDPDSGVSSGARAPKVFDPVAGTMVNWSTLVTAGTLPTGCPVIALYRDRIFLASAYADPVQWYASRQGDPFDWDFGADPDDAQAAISGSISEAGRTGEPITAMISHSNNCMIIGGHKSIWVMRGDPHFGGEIQPLSKEIGILGRFAWCHAPAKVDQAGPRLLVFMSQDGLYVIPAGCENDLTPQSMSREKMPEELLNIDPGTYHVTLAYDVRHRGIHVLVSPVAAGGTAQHWWVDWETRGFFQVTHSEDFDAITVVSRRNYFPDTTGKSDVALAGRDGYVRHYDTAQETDDGTAFSSYVDIGPLMAGQYGSLEGVLSEMYVKLAEDSNKVNVSVRAGYSAEEANGATAQTTFKVTAGSEHTYYPRVRGTDFFVRYANAQTGLKWGLERARLKIQQRSEAR